MNCVLFDDQHRSDLLPLVFLRPVADLRCGILTFKEKWERALEVKASYQTQAYLQQEFPAIYSEDNWYINAAVFPNPKLVDAIMALQPGEMLQQGTDILAARTPRAAISADEMAAQLKNKEADVEYQRIRYTYDIFRLNDQALRADFEAVTRGRQSAPLSPDNRVMGAGQVFVEPGAQVNLATINATTGPVYIGKNSQLLEGALVRGPLAILDSAGVKMGTKIYGATTIGPYSRVGGEIKNVVIMGFSNKGHEGYLGDSVLGHWCNLGADTNNSNLKNNYSQVKVWNYTHKLYQNSGLNYCGLIMGDHSKCSINTMFNTGTVVGVSANIFGAGFPPKFVPSFSWGGATGFTTYKKEKALEVARTVMQRRNQQLSPGQEAILHTVFEQTQEFRV